MFEKMPLEVVPPVFLEVRGLQDGEYHVEWWDTYEPDKIARAEAVCINGILRLETPEIERDIACKLRLQKN